MHIYTLTWNEEKVIQYFIDHYRTRFPDCEITVYDNCSDDSTVKIAQENGCHVIPFDTGGKIYNSNYLKIKNNCWKNSKSKWVIVCDVDELLDINEEQLKEEEEKGFTIISTLGFNMVNTSPDPDNFNLNLEYGLAAKQYNKSILFDRTKIKEINYSPGCHVCQPEGTIKHSSTSYPLYHNKMVGLNYVLERYRLCGLRRSDEDKKYNWGFHYSKKPEDIIGEYEIARTNQFLKKLR